MRSVPPWLLWTWRFRRLRQLLGCQFSISSKIFSVCLLSFAEKSIVARITWFFSHVKLTFFVMSVVNHFAIPLERKKNYRTALFWLYSISIKSWVLDTFQDVGIFENFFASFNWIVFLFSFYSRPHRRQKAKNKWTITINSTTPFWAFSIVHRNTIDATCTEQHLIINSNTVFILQFIVTLNYRFVFCGNFNKYFDGIKQWKFLLSVHLNLFL